MAFSGQGALGGAAAGASAGAAAGPWGAAIGGVVGAIGGGLLGGKKQKGGLGPEGTINWNYKNYLKQVQALRDAGKKFGFHPLALMGNAGVSAGQVAPVGQSAQGDWTSDALMSLGSTAADLYQDDVDAGLADDRRFERILAEQNAIGEQQKLDAADAEYRKAVLDEVRSRTALNQARMAELGGARAMSTDPVRLQDAFGGSLYPEPGRSSAEHYEREYGDIVSEGYGLTNWIRDMWMTPSGTLGSVAPRPGVRFSRAPLP